MHPSVHELWRAFLASGAAPPDAGSSSLSAFHFCDNQADADACAALAVQGRKRATALSVWGLEARGEPLPEPGDFSIVTDWAGVAQCVIRTTAVRVVPFNDVSPEHAAAEGEGDGSLEYWRAVHKSYYERELACTPFAFDEQMPIACETFTMVFPANERRR